MDTSSGLLEMLLQEVLQEQLRLCFCIIWIMHELDLAPMPRMLAVTVSASLKGYWMSTEKHCRVMELLVYTEDLVFRSWELLCTGACILGFTTL